MKKNAKDKRRPSGRFKASSSSPTSTADSPTAAPVNSTGILTAPEPIAAPSNIRQKSLHRDEEDDSVEQSGSNMIAMDPSPNRTVTSPYTEEADDTQADDTQASDDTEAALEQSGPNMIAMDPSQFQPNRPSQALIRKRTILRRMILRR